MNQIVGALVLLALVLGGCASGMTEDSKRQSARSEEKMEMGGGGGGGGGY